MKLRLYLISIFIAFVIASKAQPSEVIYQGDILKTGFYNTLVSPFTDDGPFEIGFNFKFYGNTYTQFYFSPDGFISFTDLGANYSTESDIPNTALPNNYIAPFWDNLATDPSGKILYKTIGSTGNRKLIIQYSNMLLYSSPINFLGTFQIILYETSNIIQVQYRLIVDPVSPRAHGSSATIGIENSDGTAGLKYSYATASINKEQAISFTPTLPDCLVYTLNSDDTYDGVYLTTNLSLPEPGITNLTSPPQDGVIGSDHTFTWSESSNAASYTLRISPNADMSGAIGYPAGSNLSYDITGLSVPATYYWQVFATNATGTTWCETKKFTTNSFPPLAAVPQTIWTEVNLDKTIKLNYTGGDASTKTAIINTLPSQGTLWQYNAGAKGAQITAVPESVTDPGRNVIYTAPASSGNGIGNFKYRMHDDSGDSPEATITVNVSPAGIPNVLNISKGTNIEIELDRLMSDPTGKHGQFTVTVDGSPATMTSAALKPGDPYTITLGLSPGLVGTETVLVSYTQGDVTSTAGGFLLSFTDQPVTLRSQSISFTQSLDKKFNESPFNLTATASSVLGMTYSSSNLAVATISTNVVTLKAPGTSGITARQAGNATWAPAKYLRTLVVTKADQTITFGALPDKVYGDDDFSLTAGAGSLLLVSFVSSNLGVATVTGNTVHIVGAGTTTITASQGGDANWNPAPDVPQVLTVNKADQTIIFGALPDKVYGDSDFSLTAGAGSLLLVSFVSSNLAVATVTGNIVTIVGAGTTTITASQGGDANWNPAADVPQNLTVNKADQTITFGPLLEKTFGHPDFQLFASSGSGLTINYASSNSSVATVSGDMVHITGTGSTDITASQPGDANYNPATDVTQALSVFTGNASVTLESLDEVYDGLPHAATAVTVPAGLNVLFTYNGSASPPADAGSYTVEASVDDPDYHGTATGTLVISKAEQTIVFGALPDKVYGDDDFTLSAVSGSGFQVGFVSSNLAVATVSGNTVTIVGAGSTTITASQAGDANWNSAPDVARTLTINKAAATVTLGSLSSTYNGSAQAASALTTPSGLTVDLSYDGSVAIPVNAGSYAVAGSINDINYAGTSSGTLVISKADLTVTADDKTREYNTPNPGLTYSISGFVNSETVSVIDVLPAISTAATQSSPAGTYPITLSGANDNNYTFIYIPGTLTIEMSGQVITINDLPEKLLVKDSYLMDATSTSALPVQFESLDTDIATVSGYQLTGVSAGTVTIRAYHPGDQNYYSAEATGSVEVYSTHKDIMHLFTPNNDGINDYWELPLSEWGKCDVRVFSRSGKLVFANPDYDNRWDGTSGGGAVPEGAYYFVVRTEKAGDVKGTVNVVR